MKGETTLSLMMSCVCRPFDQSRRYSDGYELMNPPLCDMPTKDYNRDAMIGKFLQYVLPRVNRRIDHQQNCLCNN
jgi:hypothetical protein